MNFQNGKHGRALYYFSGKYNRAGRAAPDHFSLSQWNWEPFLTC